MKEKLDLAELARLRWVEKWTIEKLAGHFGLGTTALKERPSEIKRRPSLAGLISGPGTFEVAKKVIFMNLEKLVNFGVAVALVAAFAGRLDQFTWQVQLATLKALKASQASTWGSPKVFDKRK